MSKYLSISNSEKTIIIDDDDFDFVKKYKWRRNANGYVIGTFTYKGEKAVFCHLHILIAKSRNIGIVDHINRDKLDNRKKNLRITDRSSNQKNRGISKRNKSKYIGVFFDNTTKKWIASVSEKTKFLFHKQFNTAIDAAMARDEFIINNLISKYHFFELNFK